MRIETARAGDAPTVLALVEELLCELGAEGEEFAEVDRAKLQAALQAVLGSAPGADGRCDAAHAPGVTGLTALIAREDDGRPVGILTLSAGFAVYAGGAYGIIDEMYVRPAWRGMGVGRALLEQALDMARRLGWHRVDVTTPADDRGNGAGRFYRGCGFEPTGEKLRLPLGD
jgi:GNAT superfamily N-acetyltransferase